MRGIKAKKYELLNYLEANNIPIALITETHLQPSINFKCTNFRTYRSDRLAQRGGGTAILIRQDIKQNEFLLQLQRIEATAIQLRINRELITLASVYNPSGQILLRYLDLLLQMSHKVILAGDFNAKHTSWRARQNNTAGQYLLKHYYKNNYVLSVPSHPTHFPDNNPSRADILDFAILSNVLTKHSIRTLGNLSSSDHRPVLLSFPCPLEPVDSIPSFNYNAADWDLFQSHVVDHLNTQCVNGSCSIKEIDVAINHLTDIINSAARIAIPRRSGTIRPMQIAASTRTLIHKRNKLRAQWQRTHDISLRPLINSLKEQIDSAVQSQVSDTWKKTLQGLDTTNMNATWRITKCLTKDNYNIPPL
jgi:exonuclease III